MTAANLIVIFISNSSTSTTPTPTDNQSNTYVKERSFNGGQGSIATLWRCFSPTTAASHTFSVSADVDPSMLVLALSGSSGAADVQNDGAGTTTSMQYNGITPTVANDCIIGGIAWVGTVASSPSINQSFVIPASNGTFLPGTANAKGSGIAYLFQGAAGNVSPTWSWTGTEPAAPDGVIVAYKGSGWALVANTAAGSTNGTSVTTGAINTSGAVATGCNRMLLGVGCSIGWRASLPLAAAWRMGKILGDNPVVSRRRLLRGNL